jgi:hypothetical protein
MYSIPVLTIFCYQAALLTVILGVPALICKIVWRIQDWRLERRRYSCRDCGAMCRGEDLSGAYIESLNAVVPVCPACYERRYSRRPMMRTE